MKTAIDSEEGIGCEAMTTYGSCDVSGCQRATYMGWRPLTERRGRQICEYHWRQHQDKQDSFDLLESFGFRRPPQAPKTEPSAKPACNCGREITPNISSVMYVQPNGNANAISSTTTARRIIKRSLLKKVA